MTALGNKVYVALAGGTIQTYQLEGLQDGKLRSFHLLLSQKLTHSDWSIVVGSSVPKAKLISTRKGLTRKPIDQMEYLEDLDALAVLSGESRAT